MYKRQPVGRGSTVRRVHLQDPALPRLLERGGAVADFGVDKPVSYTHLDVYKRQV